MTLKPRCTECGAPVPDGAVPVCEECAAILAPLDSERDTEDVVAVDESEEDE